MRAATAALVLLAPQGYAEVVESTAPLVVSASDRPNIVLVLADDLGFSDLGSYGSEINTPSLDALAQEGVRFTNYHTAANCAPARAMLLTGVDAHLAGVPSQNDRRTGAIGIPHPGCAVPRRRGDASAVGAPRGATDPVLVPG